MIIKTQKIDINKDIKKNLKMVLWNRENLDLMKYLKKDMILLTLNKVKEELVIQEETHSLLHINRTKSLIEYI